MKKSFYIFSFTVLGILLGFLVHAFVEIWYIKGLIKNFALFGLGLSFDNWFIIHKIWSVVTLVGGAVFGYRQGKYWWQKLYVEKIYKKHWKFSGKKPHLFFVVFLLIIVLSLLSLLT